MTAQRASLAAFAVLGILLATPLAALAKDVCLVDTAGDSWIFQKVKKFKTGRAVPLSGLYITGGETFPVHGMAVLRPDGNVEAGVLVHAMSGGIFSGHNFTASMQVTTGLQGTGGLDSDGDYVLNAGAYGWSAADCATLSIP
jgi:hypothetical protein